jgi:hypothetical protein
MAVKERAPKEAAAPRLMVVADRALPANASANPTIASRSSPTVGVAFERERAALAWYLKSFISILPAVIADEDAA